MKSVLIACEESQRTCIEFRKRGFRAFSCDIQPCSGGHPEWHILGDVLPILNGNCWFRLENGIQDCVDGKWDLIIAHPPCTYLSNAGACRMYPKAGVIDEKRFALAMKAKDFFFKMLNADCEHICVENPLPLKCVELPEPSQIIQPYMFGDPYTKKTLLWLKNLPQLIPTNIINPVGPFVCGNSDIWKKQAAGGVVFGKGKNAKERSKTFPGIAKAFAEQWGDLL